MSRLCEGRSREDRQCVGMSQETMAGMNETLYRCRLKSCCHHSEKKKFNASMENIYIYVLSFILSPLDILQMRLSYS